MFRSARWRGEKIRIKEVFKLQLHATQVLQSGVDALTVSLVPAGVGKPTLRLQKAIVRDGTCRWENPVYETVKFVRDPKTGKINERIYRLIVSSGSSKARLIGEVTVDFSDYAESTKPSTLSLPLKNSNTVLHVLIHRLQNIANEREVEETQEVKGKSRNRSLRSHFSLGDMDDSIENNCTEDDPFSKTTHNDGLIGNRRASSGSDVTLSSSDTSSGLNTPLELALRNSIQPDPASILSSLGLSEDSEPMEEHQKLQWVSSDGSDPGINTDDSMHSPQDTRGQESCEQSSDDEVEKLKAELAVLARQADVTELELQTLRKQIVKESKRGQDLSREVVSLKEERNALEAECEKLKAFQKCGDDTKAINKLQAEGGDVWALLEETRQGLNHEKDQNASLRIQLQKTQESNAELILAVRELDEMLEQKDREISDLWNGSGFHENPEELKGVFSKCETGDDEEQKALEEIVKEHKDAKEAYMLEQKIVDLCNELEIYRRDKDELEMQMEHLALDYEILKQENHNMSYKLEQSALQEQLKMQYECSSSFVNVNKLESKVESLEKELQKKLNEFSDSLATIDKLEACIEGLEEELEKQARGFEADVEALMLSKVEQEQRAIQAEETLRKTRWKNANTADRIQEEFRSLSTQMSSTFEANEKVAMKALKEAGDLRMQKTQLEELFRKANEELQATRDDYDVKLLKLSNLLDSRTKMLLENDNKCKQLKSQIKHEEEVDGALSQEILVLKAQVKRFTTENNLLSQQALSEPHNLKEVENMREKIKLLQEQINSKEADLETSTNLFLENEKDLQKKIEELEITMEELNQNSSKLCTQPSEKVEGETGKITSNGRTLSDEVLTELTSLKERNNSMESELEEMQERYSEISLKFAEVEGERQQLVMTVRNLKNANKSK